MPFQPGQSGNPLGRPRGFAGVAKQIMTATRDGAELVEWALALWRDVNCSPTLRMQAFEWLSDRGLGKPVQMTELAPAGTFEAGRDWEQVPLEKRRAALEQLRGMRVIDTTSAPSPVENRVTDPKVVDEQPVLLPELVARADEE